MKVCYNSCYGGFSLSDAAVSRLAELGVHTSTHDHDLQRHNPLLVQVVEELGGLANGICADIRIASIPGTEYRIDEYDGRESVQARDSYDWIDGGAK